MVGPTAVRSFSTRTFTGHGSRSAGPAARDLHQHFVCPPPPGSRSSGHAHHGHADHVPGRRRRTRRSRSVIVPLTILAHQAAVLPLKLARPRWFDGTALVIGSMAPDLVFVLHGTNLYTDAHRIGA